MKNKKSIPISQQDIYEDLKKNNMKKIVDYCLYPVKKALNITVTYKDVQLIGYSSKV